MQRSLTWYLHPILRGTVAMSMACLTSNAWAQDTAHETPVSFRSSPWLPVITSVKPDDGAAAPRLGEPSVWPSYATMSVQANTSSNTAGFDVANTDWQSESYSISCYGGGSVTSVEGCPWSVYVEGYSSAYVPVDFSTGSAGWGQVGLSAGGGIGGADGYYDVTVTDPRTPPIIALASNPDMRDVSRCVANCFEHVMTYSPPAYVSRDEPRAVTLVYRSGSAAPVGIVELDVTDNSSVPADSFKIQLQRPDQSFVTFLNGSNVLYFRAPHQQGAVTRVVAAFNAAALPTKSYLYTAYVTSLWSDNMATSVSTVRVIVQNEAASPYGAGWTVAGVQRIYAQSDGILVTDGSGSASFFAGTCPTGTCTYTSPGGDFSVLSHNVNGYHRRYPDGTQLDFADNVHLSTAMDRFGNASFYTYSGPNGALTAIQDPSSHSTIFGYEDGSGGWKIGTLRSIQTPGSSGSRDAWFGVNQSNDLIHFLDPDGIYFGFADYSSDHRLNHFHDRRGGDWDVAYAWDGTLQSIQAPKISAFPTDASQTVDSLRPTTSYVGPSTRLFAAIGGGAGTVNNPVANTLDKRATITNPRSRATYFSLNRWGAPTLVVPPSVSLTTSNEYNPTTGQLWRSVGAASHDIRYTWTGPNLTQVYDYSANKTVNAAYEPLFNQVDSIWGATKYQAFYYDAARLGHPLTSSREGVYFAPLTTYTVDVNGRLTGVTDIAGHTTTVYYGTSGFQNTDSTIAPGHRLTAVRYDAFGRPVSVLNPAIGAKDSVEYDVVNRVTASIDGQSRRTTFHYDSLLLRATVDPLGQRDSVVKNALGWVTHEYRPGSSNPLQWTFDLNGNMRKSIDRRGNTVAFHYDEIDRDTLRVTGSDSARSSYVAYAYPSGGIAGYVATRNAESADTSFFDIQGLLKRRNVGLAGSWYAFDYTYGYDGQLERRDATSNQWAGQKTVQFGYNTARTALATLTAFGQATQLGLDNEGLTTTINYPNGLVDTLLTTTNHETYSSRFNNPDANLKLGANVLLDRLGRITDRRRSMGDSLKTYNYYLDGALANRAIYRPAETSCPPPDPHNPPDQGYECSRTEPLDHVEWYTYDDAGNLLNRVAQLELPGNRVRADSNGVFYHYDLDGNLDTTSQLGLSRTLQWNALGQLTSVVINSSTTVSYGYDAVGGRVRRTVNGVPTYSLYEGDNLFLTLNSSGNVVAEYANWPGIDSPHSVQIAGVQYNYVFDPVSGSVHGVVRASDKVVVAQYGYTPFGVSEGAFDNIGNSIRFAGRELDDETGFYYFRARWYAPELGRFISEDPIGAAGGMNLYAYANNDPINGADPYGLIPQPGCVQVYPFPSGPPTKGTVAACKGPPMFAGRIPPNPREWLTSQAPFKPVAAGGVNGAFGLSGVYVGTWRIPFTLWTARHSAIAWQTVDGNVHVSELVGWTESRRIKFHNDIHPKYGGFADYQWTRVADASMIPAVQETLDALQQRAGGHYYVPPLSNVYVNSGILLSGIGPLAMWQNRLLGWAPGLTPLFFGRYW